MAAQTIVYSTLNDLIAVLGHGQVENSPDFKKHELALTVYRSAMNVTMRQHMANDEPTAIRHW
jgi:hypothetical protein